MKKNLNSMNDNLLHNVSNYKHCITNSVQEILTKFVSVILEYMKLVSEKLTMKNKPHYKFIFERGLETLIHVFTMILYFTKNLELTFYHTQKAYYFYIEFIEQISDDNITFLQLTSRDAIMFVYRKTIFDLNNEYKKSMKEPSSDEIMLMSSINVYTNIYKNIVQFIINHKDFKYETKLDYIKLCCCSIEFVSDALNENKIEKETLDCIYVFTNFLSDKKLKTNDFFKLLDDFINVICLKNGMSEKLIKNKLHEQEIHILIENNELHKIVDLIFTD
jgi:hypothetical protein